MRVPPARTSASVGAVQPFGRTKCLTNPIFQDLRVEFRGNLQKPDSGLPDGFTLDGIAHERPVLMVAVPLIFHGKCRHPGPVDPIQAVHGQITVDFINNIRTAFNWQRGHGSRTEARSESKGQATGP